MSDPTFRETVEPAPAEVLPQPKKATVGPTTSTVEVPFLDYHSEHGSPFTVDYFKLGDTWNNRNGGFANEVNTIESYFRTQIESGELPNDVSSIKKRLKEIEKVANVAKEDRMVVKIGAVSSYLRFLVDVDDIKHNMKRYGSK